MATLAVTNSFSAGTTIVAADMNENFDDVEAFVNSTPGVVQNDIVDAKGDLIAATGSDAVSRLAVGTNTYVLTADSTEATGLIWSAPTTGDLTGLTAGNLVDITAASGPVPTIDVDLSEASTSTSDADGDYFIVTDAASAQYKLTKANIALSGFNNDSGFGVGDITAVVAGTNISGGATSGSATVNLAIDAAVDVGVDGTGVDVSFHTTAAGDLMLWDASDKALEFTDSKITMGDNLIETPELIDYAETVNAIGGTGGGTQSLNIALGNVQTATVDTSTNTFTFDNPSPDTKSCSFTLILTNGGSQTVVWPTTVQWAGGTAPTLTASGRDVLTFMTIDAGAATWYGFAAGLDMSVPS
jgi:hypothetical protein